MNTLIAIWCESLESFTYHWYLTQPRLPCDKNLFSPNIKCQLLLTGTKTVSLILNFMETCSIFVLDEEKICSSSNIRCGIRRKKDAFKIDRLSSRGSTCTSYNDALYKFSLYCDVITCTKLTPDVVPVYIRISWRISSRFISKWGFVLLLTKTNYMHIKLNCFEYIKMYFKNYKSLPKHIQISLIWSIVYKMDSFIISLFAMIPNLPCISGKLTNKDSFCK